MIVPRRLVDDVVAGTSGGNMSATSIDEECTCVGCLGRVGISRAACVRECVWVMW